MNENPQSIEHLRYQGVDGDGRLLLKRGDETIKCRISYDDLHDLKISSLRIGTLLILADMSLIHDDVWQAKHVEISPKESFTASLVAYNRREGKLHSYQAHFVPDEDGRIPGVAQGLADLNVPVTIKLGNKFGMGLSDAFKGSAASVYAKTIILELQNLREEPGLVFVQAAPKI